MLREAVGGLQQVMRRGRFSLPPSVVNATERFKMEADPMRGFLEERVTFHHSNDPTFTPRTDIYNAYVAWAVVNGFHQMSAQRFYESFATAATDMSNYPIVPVTRDGTRGFKGIAIK